MSSSGIIVSTGDDDKPTPPGSPVAPAAPLTPTTPSIGGAIKSSGWKNLPPFPLDEQWDETLPLGPADRIRHGTLPNGMIYYVMRTYKPKDRAALALAVDVGSIAETEEEQGVAHICEHLAFRATKDYENFQIVKFLESIGAEFGACQNAYTSMDETVYELLIPVDKPEILDESLKVMAQFATKVRISDEDVDAERGAVMEELRQGKDARGRASEAYWKLLMEGCLYAERLPIGLESVIRHADPAVLRGFYAKWYRPERMAIIVTGDFNNLDDVVTKIKEEFTPTTRLPGQPAVNPIVHRPLVKSHADPRTVCVVDKEQTKTMVTITFKYENLGCATPGKFFLKTVEDAFKLALDNRLYKLMRSRDPPFFSGVCSVEDATRTCCVFSVQTMCEEGKAKEGLEAALREIARCRLHGFTQQELRICIAKQLAEAEQLFVERDQTYCTSLRDELVGHFLREEMVVGAEEEARLSKACCNKITLKHLTDFAVGLRLDNSCVIRVMEGRARCSERDIRDAITAIAEEEAAGNIKEAVLFNVPASLMPPPSGVPPPGTVTTTRTYPKCGFEECELSNGMRVAMKVTDFLDDQVVMRLFARGGLSEVPQREYLNALYAGTIAAELGQFGVKPEVFHDVMAGKRCETAIKTASYHRRMDGDLSPMDLETGLQLVHILFTKDVRDMLVPEELEVVLRMQEQAIRNRRRDPLSVYNETVRHLVYGRSFQTAPLQPRDVRRMQPVEACRHFREFFSNPREFTLVLCGAFDPRRVKPMLEKYLASIPVPEKAARPIVKQVTPVPFKFPSGAVSADVRVPMVEPMSMASITFPVNIPNPDYRPPAARDRRGAMARGGGAGRGGRGEAGAVGAAAGGDDTAVATTIAVTLDGALKLIKQKLTCSLAAQIIERRLLALLRFKFGEIYTCAASASFAYQDPGATGEFYRGDVMINFSCEPEAGNRLAQLAVEDVKALREEGPTPEEVATAVEVEQRALEVRRQENTYWREYYEAMRNSRLLPQFSGDLDRLYELTEMIRGELLSGLTPEMIRDHLQVALKVTNRIKVVLRPQRPLWRRLLMPMPSDVAALVPSSPATAAAVAAAAAAAAAAAIVIMRRRSS